MSDDPNSNIYRHQWSKAARAAAGYPEETKAQTLDRLKQSTSDSGQREYARMLKKGGKS